MALRHCTVNDPDCRTHTEQAAMIRAHIRWRNHRATPDVDVA